MIPHDPQQSAYEQGCKDTINRIADELEILSNSYVDCLREGSNLYDIWTWTAKLAVSVRSGEMTKPLPTEPPF